jgi:hypothetical protein
MENTKLCPQCGLDIEGAEHQRQCWFRLQQEAVGRRMHPRSGTPPEEPLNGR